MQKLLTADQMRRCDDYTSEYFGLSSIVLMERAALETYRVILERHSFRKSDRILMLCGTGNNGADGLALARLFFENGYTVSYAVVLDTGRHSELFDVQHRILERYGVHEANVEDACGPDCKYALIVDALFGIGMHRPVTMPSQAMITSSGT